MPRPCLWRKRRVDGTIGFRSDFLLLLPFSLRRHSFRTGDAPPDGAHPLLRGKGWTKTRPAEPPADGGFPPLRRCFGAGQKLAFGSDSLSGLLPKPPFRSGGSARGSSANTNQSYDVDFVGAVCRPRRFLTLAASKCRHKKGEDGFRVLACDIVKNLRDEPPLIPPAAG